MRTRRHALRHRVHKPLGTAVSAALLSSALVVAAPTAAQAAEPFGPGLLGVGAGSSSIFTVDAVTGATTNVIAPPTDITPANVGLNQLAVSPDGTTLVMTDQATDGTSTKVISYNTGSEQWQQTPRTTPTVERQMGGFDSTDNLYYFGGRVGTTDTFSFATYDPAANTIPARRITVTAESAPGGNGDLVFDRLGNLYFVSGSAIGTAATSTATAQVYRVNAADLETGTAKAAPVGKPISGGVRITSIAFGTDGFLYIGGARPTNAGGSAVQRVNPITGAADAAQLVSGRTLNDLAARARPVTVQIPAPTVTDPVNPTDQFTTTITGNGIAPPGNSATSGGTGPTTIGPLLIVPSTDPYTVTQTGAGSTDLNNYDTTYRCVDLTTPEGSDGHVLSSGTGSVATFSVTAANRPNVSCTFTNTPKAGPTAPNETSADNTLGQPVTVPTTATGDGVTGADVVIVGADAGSDGRTKTVTGEGTWTVNPADGAITFTPQTGYTGNPAPIEYQVTDDENRTATGTVSVLYTPEAVADSALRRPQGPVTVPVLTNDRGVTDPASVRIVGAPDNGRELVVAGEGTWTVNPANGAITFTPAAGFSGNPTAIQYTVAGPGGTKTTQASVTVTYVSAAVDDVSNGNEQGEPVLVEVLDNDLGTLVPGSVVILGPLGPVKTLDVDGQGTWAVDPISGTITFTPEEGFSGNPTPITYRVTDSDGQDTTASVTITYDPIAVADVSNGNPLDQPVVVRVLDNDLGTYDSTTLKIVDAPGDGLVLDVTDQGRWTVDVIAGTITFTRADGFTGNPDPIRYTVEDENGNPTGAPVTVTFAPTAVADADRGNTQDTDVTVDVLKNDRGSVDPKTVVIVGAPGDGKALVVDGEGTWTVDPATGAITFAPQDGFSGNPKPITYEVSGTGADSGETTRADVVVTYLPGAVADRDLNNAQGTDVTIGVLDNDLGDLDPTSVVIVGAPGDGKKLDVDGQGTWTVDPDTGAITFAPQDDFSGNPKPITYRVTDVEGETSTASVTVTYVPGGKDDADLRNEQGTDVTIDVLANDLGDLDPETVVIVGAPGDGKQLDVDGEGTWTVDPDTGAITFSPEEGFSGNPTPIDYEVDDVEGNTTSAEVVVTYAPQGVDDESRGNRELTAVTVDVLDNDLGDLDPTTVVIVGAPGDGKELVVDGEGTWTVDPTTGAITFVQEAGFEGNPTPITYEVDDVEGNTTSAEVVVTYGPEALDDESRGNAQGTVVTLDVLDNDLGVLDPATVRITGAPGNRRTLDVEDQGTWTVNPETGAITFTPEDGFNGDPTPISYTVEDVDGNGTGADVVVTYGPEAVDDEDLRNAQGTDVTVDVLDNDLGDFLPGSVVIDGAPGTGKTLDVDGEGTWTVDPVTGAITFSPDEDFSGNPTPITYTVSDTEGATSSAEVVVTYLPQAADDASLRNEQGTDVTVDVLDDDLGDLDPKTVVIVGAPGDGKQLVVDGEGTWTVDPATGAITFSPEDGFSGNPTPITYEVDDVAGNTTSAGVVVTYLPKAANDESLDNESGTAVTVDPLANDLGDLDPTTVVIVGAPGDGKELVVDGEGTWTVDPVSGAITFTPEDGFQGDPTPITYEVDDTAGNTTEATVTITYGDPDVSDGGGGTGGDGGAGDTGDRGGLLPDTGGEALGLLLAGLAAIAAGMALVARRRRA